MRKIMNKKGFSLVELMIVVVIMGILIAVAVPLYDVLVDKSKESVCLANQDTVKTCFDKWMLMDSGNSPRTLFKNNGTSFDGSTQDAKNVFADSYLDCFEDGTIPTCPVEDHYYKVTIVDDVTIKIECKAKPTADDDTEHTDKSES